MTPKFHVIRYVSALLSVGLLQKFEAYLVYLSLIWTKNPRRFSFFQKFRHFTYMLLWFHLVIPSFPARIDDMRSRFSALSPRQVSCRKQFSQTPFWALLTWISAGIKHSCSLGILLMLMLQHRVQHPCKVSIWWILYSMYIKTNLLRMWRGQKRLQDLAKSSKRTVLCFKVKEGRVKEQAVWQKSTCYRPE